MFVIHLLRKGDWVLDVGANLGVYAAIAARRGASVIAFEPNEASRAILRANAELNDVASNIRIHQAAVSDFNGKAMFTSGLDIKNHLAFSMDQAAYGSQVSVVRLDDFCRDNYAAIFQNASLLKIDVEGFDLHVLRGASHLIAAAKPVIIIEIWNGGRDVRAWLEARGYRVYTYAWDRRCLCDVPPDFDGQGNFIAVHRFRKNSIDERLMSGKVAPMRAPRVNWIVPRTSWPKAEKP